MAFMENRNGKFRIKFRFEGKQHSRSLKTDNERKAQLAKGQIERNLELVSLGLLSVPDDCEIFDFLLTGKAPNQSADETQAKASQKRSTAKLLVGKLFDLYFAAFLRESIEDNSYGMLKTHRNNLERLVGKQTKAASVGTAEIQGYVDRRAKEKGRRGLIKPVTIRKEVTTLSTVFEWAVSNGHLEASPSKKGIRYPKGKEKPPFQTWDEIERKIHRGGLSKDEVAELWECLFLDTGQIQDLLLHVKLNARQGFIYPAFVFAAHTGARRSEMSLNPNYCAVTEPEVLRTRGVKNEPKAQIFPGPPGGQEKITKKWLVPVLARVL